uniref:Uncharacterized protein n=1 Tax=Nelumbo nucifera TaxID=4432 RepID=A0A822ZI11_NELNU|nr:TPA_asm: hypothetical protein HUJ06_000896 [Nelumbo nucifera]
MVKKFISLVHEERAKKADNPEQTKKFISETANDLYQEVAKVAEEARDCYEKGSTKEFSDEEFKRLMFMDGCFVVYFIHFMVTDDSEQLEMKNDDIYFVESDLFLMENHLPFLVLRTLMSSAYASDDEWREV